MVISTDFIGSYKSNYHTIMRVPGVHRKGYHDGRVTQYTDGVIFYGMENVLKLEYDIERRASISILA